MSPRGIDVVREARVARPRAEVAAFAMDPANDRRWIGALTAVRVLGDGPVAAGTRVERTAAFLGRRMTYVNEIEEIVPGERLAMRSVVAPFPMTVTYEFADAGPAATTVRIRAAGDAAGHYRVARPLLAAMVGRGIARDLRMLARCMEGGGGG